MKKKLSSILAVIILLTSTVAFAQEKKPDPKFHIYHCLGRSNMEDGSRPEAQDHGTLDPWFQMLAAVNKIPPRAKTCSRSLITLVTQK